MDNSIKKDNEDTEEGIDLFGAWLCAMNEGESKNNASAGRGEPIAKQKRRKKKRKQAAMARKRNKRQRK